MPPPSCKYCKSESHRIDDCPDVVCLNCKQVGHPHWRCNWSTEFRSSKTSKTSKTLSPDRPTYQKVNTSSIESSSKTKLQSQYKSGNSFKALDSDDDSEHDEPLSSNILDVMKYRTTPWGNL